MPATPELVLTSVSFARIRFLIVMRRTQNRPPGFWHRCA